MTARSILGLLPPYARKTLSGRVLYQGTDLLSLPSERLARMRGAEIAMIFQDPLTYLNPRMSVGKQIGEAIWLHRPMEQIESETANSLARVGLRSDRAFMRSFPHELSGGMRQRVMIAMAVASRPKLLIADEPTTALDVTLQAQILDLLDELCHEMGLALLFITHDMGVVAELCDTVHVMYGGQIVESGDTGNIFAKPQHPYSQALLGAALSIEKKQDDFVTIGGAVPDLVNPPAGCRFRPRCKQAHARCAEPPPNVATTAQTVSRCWLHSEAA
jgi:oligopeptide/dipeptide ABC transporter ATP-binding protein